MSPHIAMVRWVINSPIFMKPECIMVCRVEYQTVIAKKSFKSRYSDWSYLLFPFEIICIFFFLMPTLKLRHNHIVNGRYTIFSNFIIFNIKSISILLSSHTNTHTHNLGSVQRLSAHTMIMSLLTQSRDCHMMGSSSSSSSYHHYKVFPSVIKHKTSKFCQINK